jgi:hypothetical protein
MAPELYLSPLPIRTHRGNESGLAGRVLIVSKIVLTIRAIDAPRDRVGNASLVGIVKGTNGEPLTAYPGFGCGVKGNLLPVGDNGPRGDAS